MSVHDTEVECRVTFVDDDEGGELFERTAQACMGLSGDEFLAAWDSGQFDGVNWDDVPGLAEVALTLPFIRR